MALIYLERTELSRIAPTWDRLKQQQRKALIPYIVAGDPEASVTVDLMHALVGAGADMIELGVPFSDPMAEGPVIQKGHERALAQKVSLRACLSMVTAFRETDQSTPVILMGYANPIEHMGHSAFATAASDAGIDGVITVDLPPEEVGAMNIELKRVGIDNIFLIAPTTPDERVPVITDQASGFIYYVSLKGVTGAGHLDFTEVAEKVNFVKGHTDLPVAVGFGIKDAESANRIGANADGVVVGSALVDLLGNAEWSISERQARAIALVADIRAGI